MHRKNDYDIGGEAVDNCPLSPLLTFKNFQIMYVTVIDRATNEVIMDKCPVGFSQHHDEIEQNVCTNLGLKWMDVEFIYGRA